MTAPTGRVYSRDTKINIQCDAHTEDVMVMAQYVHEHDDPGSTLAALPIKKPNFFQWGYADMAAHWQYT